MPVSRVRHEAELASGHLLTSIPTNHLVQFNLSHDYLASQLKYPISTLSDCQLALGGN